MSRAILRPNAQTTDECVKDSISKLEAMPLPQLRTYWAERWGDAPAYRARDQILRAAAWKLQADAYGGGSSKTRRDLNRFGTRFASDRNFSPAATGALMPGATLVREWAGKRHEVAVVEGGFEYHGQRFTSLSAAALAITGTSWNGPVFFGVKRRKARRAGSEA